MSYFTLATFSGRAAATRPREGPMVRIRLPPAVSQANFRIPPLARPDLDASAPMNRRVPPAGWRYALVPLSRIGERVRLKLLGE